MMFPGEITLPYDNLEDIVPKSADSEECQFELLSEEDLLSRPKGDEEIVFPKDYSAFHADFLKIVERMRSYELVGATEGYKKERLATRTSEKMMIAVDTSWVPDVQRNSSQFSALVRKLGGLEQLGAVEVVCGQGEALVASLSNMVDKNKTAEWKNVIILAGDKTLKTDGFQRLLSGSADDNKPFVAGIAAKDLKDDSYIRLVEMLTMAVRMARDPELIASSAWVGVDKQNNRYVIFIPRAEAIALEKLQEIYKAQAKVLSAA
jgi:hypothetical protein